MFIRKAIGLPEARPRMVRLAALVMAVTADAPAAPAQTPTPPLANWQYSVGEILTPLAGPIPDWRIYLGAGTSFTPLYEGARRYRPEPSVAINIRYRDIAFLSDGEGLGVNLLRGPGYRAGIAVSYDLGRDHTLENRIAGLGNVDPAPEIKGFAQYTILPFVFNIDFRRAIGGHDGYIGDFGIYGPVPFSDNFTVFMGPTLSFADSRYLQAYFGVTPRQAARSSFRPFSPEGGLKSAGWGMTAIYRLSEHWWFAADGTVNRLLGDASRSPLVESRTEFAADIDVVYQF